LLVKRFLKDSALYGSATLFSKGVGLLVVPLYTRVLPREEYGVIDMLVVAGALVNLTVALEISQGLARYYPEARSPEDRVRYASTALWFTAATYGLFALVAIALSRPLAALVLDGERWHSVWEVAVAAMVANGLFYLFQNQLRWQLAARWYALASAVQVAVTAGTAVWLVVVERLGVVGIFWGQIAGFLAGSAVAWPALARNYRLSFSWSAAGEMLGFSLPLVPSSIAVFATLYTDRVAVRHFLGLGDLGLYAVAFRFASVVGLLMVGFQMALTPLVCQHYREPETPRDLARIFRYFLLPAFAVVTGLCLYSREVLSLLTGPDYRAAWSILPLLAAASLLANMYIFVPGLWIAKRTKAIAAINAGAALLNLALNFLLVPRWGTTGAAVAALLTGLCSFSGYLTGSQISYPVPHRRGRLLGGAVVGGVAAAVGLFWSSRGSAVLTLTGLLTKLGFLVLTTAVLATLLLERREREGLARAVMAARGPAGGWRAS